MVPSSVSNKDIYSSNPPFPRYQIILKKLKLKKTMEDLIVLAYLLKSKTLLNHGCLMLSFTTYMLIKLSSGPKPPTSQPQGFQGLGYSFSTKQWCLLFEWSIHILQSLLGSYFICIGLSFDKMRFTCNWVDLSWI